jgi:hypothetical protein
MLRGVSGRLLSGSFVHGVLPSLACFAPAPADVRRSLDGWWQRCEAALGPASSVRAVADIAALPLLRLLQFEVDARRDDDGMCLIRLAAGDATLTAAVWPWSEGLSHAWRPSVLAAVAADSRWCFCIDGRTLRLVDARHTWSREYLDIDLAALAGEPAVQDAVWSLLRAEACGGGVPLLDRAVDLSRRHGADVCRALGAGVLDALRLLVGGISRRSRRPAAVVFEQSLTVLYRVLFLLFAEARGAVPLWHPVYRDRYSLEAIVSSILAGDTCRGLWHALRAISRLAHAGCTTGELRVTAFNGRLFSPAQAAAFDAAPLPDTVMRQAVAALGIRPATRRSPPARIAYRELDVEQLGAVYERVLEYDPVREDGALTLARTSDARKSTGAFYTPRAVTAHLVRRTLEPLVRGRTAQQILALRILDPAMGSGAFLVAACRFLAAAAEEALIDEGVWHAHDITPAERDELRRDVAARCLYGVDLNPMAVQLARLSLWLATLAADKPLSFFDHHLVVGDSLIGATPDDTMRRRRRGGGRRDEPLPLFDQQSLSTTLEGARRVRMQLSADPDDSAAAVQQKERMLAAMRDGSLRGWERALDLWCACWFWPGGDGPDYATAAELGRHVLGVPAALPPHIARQLIERADAIAAERRFLHWPLAFPEVFVDAQGAPLAAPGFDAVIGNPPWDMVRGDSGEAEARSGRREDARAFTRFVRDSGIYHADGRGHVNRYQLFVERALQLTRTGGRLGFVLPSGMMGDTGAGPLRRRLFDAAAVDAITGIDNRDAIFPIHRGLRFVLLTCTPGAPTTQAHCRFGITHPDQLEPAGGAAPLVITRAFLSRISGDDDLGVPELASLRDLRVVEKITASCPRLGAAAGWSAHFGRELNASDDRSSFAAWTGDATARPVVEGKQIEPFRVALDRCRWQLRKDAPWRTAVPRRVRLAYRDVASAGNRLTLIAALLPARAVSTHTLFCLKPALPPGTQDVLCALLNSFVANYLVRLRVSTHVTASLMARLPVPVLAEEEAAFQQLGALARALMRGRGPVEEADEYAELQGLAAYAYGLNTEEFAHVLATFPLVSGAVRERALAWLHAITRAGQG